MADLDRFKFGAVTYPLNDDLKAGSLIQIADPALYWAAEFVKAMLERYVEPRLVAQASAANIPIRHAVEAVSYLNVGPYFGDKPYLRFPLLSIYRVSSKWAEHTVTWERQDSEWAILYVLPLLTYPQAEKLVPILHAVEQTIVNRVHEGTDPTWQGGQSPWSDAFGGVMQIAVTDSRHGVLETDSGAQHFTWAATLRVRERVEPVAGNLQPLTGVAIGAQIQDESGTTEEDVVAAKTDVTPPDPG